MPRFDFRCKKCETVFEETIPFGSKKLPPCPKCHSKAIEKLLSAPGVLFKGEGFYKTDSRPAEKTDEPAKTEPKKEMPKSEPAKKAGGLRHTGFWNS